TADEETSILQAMGQADAGRVILKMEKQIAQMDDEAQAAVFSSTVKQIKQAYRQCKKPAVSIAFSRFRVWREASSARHIRPVAAA
ncbi:hypothetical protein SEEC5569_14880, partial [Salmonella enterica subsp. enterica serovar Cerro str. 5569]